MSKPYLLLSEGITEKYSFKCKCRKPEIGMLKKAVKEHSIDIESSLLIGDKITDIQAAQAMNIRGFLFSENMNLYSFFKDIVKGD